MSKNYYKQVRIGDLMHKAACIYYTEAKKVVYFIGSFHSRQALDQCLSLFQKATYVTISENIYSKSLYTGKKEYICKCAKAKDENNADGVHAIFYSTDNRILRIYQGESLSKKVYEWLKENTKCAILPEWADYIYQELVKKDYISICEGFDYTEKAPKVLYISKDVDTKLIRDIKSMGLKNKIIDLPVKENEVISDELTFLDIIQNMIIPYIEDVKCHYNVGDKISPILSSDIVSGNKKFSLFPKQRIMAQGLLNGIKSNLPYVILCGGMGTGKTYTSIKLAYATIKEYLNKENSGTIALMVQSHLINKWKRQMLECLEPLGLKVNFITINRYEDVNKVEKAPKGIQVLIFPKDRVKRKYLENFSTAPKYPHYEKVKKEAYNTKNLESVEDVRMARIDAAKYIKIVANICEQREQHKYLLYSPIMKDNKIDGYYVYSTSDTINNALGVPKRTDAYGYEFKGTLDNLREIIKNNISKIKSEKIMHETFIMNPIVCTHCGSTIYDKGQYMFDEEKYVEYYIKHPKNITSRNKSCTSYIKADGTPLTNQEISYIRQGLSQYKVVESKYKYAYLDIDSNEPILGEKLQEVKRNPREIIILVKECKQKLVGYKEQKGYRCYDSTEYMLKKFGKNFIDFSIVDEAHLFAGSSNQGQSFGTLCRLSKVTLPLTGTLTSGRASDLFLLLYRLAPRKMKELGYEFKDVSLFVEHFGRRKKETKIIHEDKYNRSGRKLSSGWQELPGISPVLYDRLLANNMVARKLEDMDMPLPTVKYFKHEIDMDEELKCNYDSLKNEFTSFMKKYNDVNLGGSYIHTLISYPDIPNQETVNISLAGEMVEVAHPVKMNTDEILLPKEVKVIETCRKEIAEGRRVLLFATYTGEKGVSKRLVDILSKEFKVQELTSKVKLEKREEWIDKQYKDGCNIIITNPECIATGLDIIQYPTLYYYEIPCNTKTLRQSECRPIRPQQKDEVRIYYSYYKGSLQESIIQLQADKKQASLSLEGVFSEDMLSNMSSGGDSIEAQLNKILQGKIVLKEQNLDIFGFSEEEKEVSYSFNKKEDGNIEVTKKASSTEKIEMTYNEVEELNLFTIDETFMSKLKCKKKNKMPVWDQRDF